MWDGAPWTLTQPQRSQPGFKELCGEDGLIESELSHSGERGRGLVTSQKQVISWGYPQGGADLRPEGSPLKATACRRRDCSDCEPSIIPPSSWEDERFRCPGGLFTCDPSLMLRLMGYLDTEAQAKVLLLPGRGEHRPGHFPPLHVPDSRGAPRAGCSPDTHLLPKTKPRNLGDCTLAHRNTLPFRMALLT